ncbi:MAG: peptidoglycan DD-metalloendopeptidase family protein [Elusimicrobia bacterium]|nr:peptidoglycan DD-metalloendopeptidase family protein [Elusimicrobiota bacterium]
MTRRGRAGVAFLLVLAGAALSLAKESVKAKQDSLKKIQSEIDLKNREKKSAARRARELREEVDRISTELFSARKSLVDADARLLKAEKTRAEAESRLFASQQDLSEWRERLSVAVRGYYIRRSVSPEGSISALAYERALLSDRAASLSFALQNHRNVQSLRDDLASAEEDLRRVRLDKQREQRRAELAQSRMKDLQKTAEGRRLVLDREIKELNASAKRFEKMIADLLLKERQAQARAAKKAKTERAPVVARGTGQKWRGKLPWPVPGAVVGKFGRTVNADRGAPTISNGVTLRTGPDVAVKAVQGGEVLFAGPFMNYGLMALMSHPDHVHTIYAHLGGLQVVRGQKVLAGDPVGSPGRDEKGRPMMYFELRVDGEPVNPEAWLGSVY